MSDYRKYLRNQSLAGMSEMETGQQKGLSLPPIEKPYPEDAELIDLVTPDAFALGQMSLIDAVNNRRSRRRFTDEPLSLEELSFLLWCTQGVQGRVRQGLLTLRTVPSGGGMHPFETYIVCNRVTGLEPGIYRYIALEHKLLQERSGDTDLPRKVGEAANGQTFVGKGAVIFVWAVRPYRTEWRYGDDSLKDILLSAGHICQNLYLACESIGAGTCAIVAYQQTLLDDLIGVDGHDEIPIYLAPVGKVQGV
jgi:SagB-type dehydrogenase family enzyme